MASGRYWIHGVTYRFGAATSNRGGHAEGTRTTWMSVFSLSDACVMSLKRMIVLEKERELISFFSMSVSSALPTTVKFVQALWIPGEEDCDKIMYPRLIEKVDGKSAVKVNAFYTCLSLLSLKMQIFTIKIREKNVQKKGGKRICLGETIV